VGAGRRNSSSSVELHIRLAEIYESTGSSVFNLDSLLGESGKAGALQRRVLKKAEEFQLL
jgi:hypothetical protein